MTRFSKLGCTLCLLFFAALASAQDFNDGELVGQIFWVKPAKEIYRRLEFYRQPKLEAAAFFPPSKKQIRIISVGRGWIKLEFFSAYGGFEEAHIPVGYFKRNRYSASVFNSYAFDRATFFSEDPDVIKERVEVESVVANTPKSKRKSIASKFFRHKQKCCGLGGFGQREHSKKISPTPL